MVLRIHLSEVRRQQEENGLEDIVVDTAAFGNGGDDGHEVVVLEHHIRSVLGHLRAGDAHRHSYVGLLESRGVVDTVTRHGHDLTPLLPGRHDTFLLLWSDTGIDRIFVHICIKISVVELLEVSTGDGQVAFLEDAYLLSYG